MKSYLKTIQTIFTHPRQVIDSFLTDNRDNYAHPFIFCVIGVSIVILINTITGDYSFTPLIDDDITEIEGLRRLTEWTQITSVRAATQFLPLSIFLLLIPSLSVGGMLFLRGSTGGFYDHIIINSYAVGASIMVLPVLIPVWQLSGQSLTEPFMNSTLPAMVIAGIILWIYRIYFNPGSFMDWIRILSSYITGFVLYVILLGFTSAVVGYMIFAVERLSEIS